jgi:lipopolysaccharide export system permease protein
MRILNRHIAKNMTGSMLMAVGILTFVMLSGQFFRAFDLISRGVSPLLLARYLLYLLPDMLRFTLPLAMLVATVLVFSRMSADNELCAMKANGISLWQIIAPGLLLSFALSALCVWLSLWVTPLCRYRAEQLRWTALASSPLALLEPGGFVNIFPQCPIRIGQRDGDELYDIHLFMLDSAGKKVQDITARRGRVQVQVDERMVYLELDDATVMDSQLAPTEDQPRRFLAAKSIRLPMSYGVSQDRKSLSRRSKHMDLPMLISQIRLEHEAGRDTSEHLLAVQTRLSLALSPFSFLLLGLPFGVRSKRSELSVGLLLCVLLALGFYAFVLMADALADSRYHPQIIIWLPNFLYQLGGLWVIQRISRH